MLFDRIDVYCERVAPGLWQEPLNVLASVAVAILALRLAGRLRDDPGYRRLAVMLALVGAASALRHLTGLWLPMVVDVVMVSTFTLSLVHRIFTDHMAMRREVALLGTAIFLPFIVMSTPLLMGTGEEAALAMLPFPILCLGVAATVRMTNPALARGYLGCSVALALALGIRAMDMSICGSWPWGTQFVYILIAGLTLRWLIAVSARHAAGRG